MSTQMYETRMFDEDGQRRVRSVVFATAGSAIGITLFLTVTTYLISPEHGWVAALGLGAMSGNERCHYCRCNGCHHICTNGRDSNSTKVPPVRF